MSSGPPGETYFAMRYRAHTNTHQQALQAWVGRGQSEESYYENYAARVAQSVTQYRNEVAEVEQDPNMSRTEKRVECATLGQHVLHPAWDQTREEAFFRQYPESVKRSGAFINSLHLWRDDEAWGTKSPWEKTCYGAFTDPKDGSVPVVDPQPLDDLAPVEVAAPIRIPQVPEEPVIPVPTPVDSVQAPNEVVARTLEETRAKTCTFCGEVASGGTAGNKLHMSRYCLKNPNSTRASQLAVEAMNV